MLLDLLLVLRAGTPMKVDALIPLKKVSTRLPGKCFHPLRLSEDGRERIVPLWWFTYSLLSHSPLIRNIYFSLSDPELLMPVTEVLGKVPDHFVWVEGKDYPRGKTLGGTIANFCRFIEYKGEPMDYLLACQVDCGPKGPKDIENILARAEARRDIDLWVTAQESDGAQFGAYRLIKMPLNQEPLGQTIGFVPATGIDIHSHKDLEQWVALMNEVMEHAGLDNHLQL